MIAHFGSVTSNIYLYVNGQYVGYAEDAKVAAEFDITPYLKKGDNLIAFQTFRWCDGSWCEDQDFWRLSGVARDSYLYAREPMQKWIERGIMAVKECWISTDHGMELAVTPMITGKGQQHFLQIFLKGNSTLN